jgi:hypothetical protein
MPFNGPLTAIDAILADDAWSDAALEEKTLALLVGNLRAT